MVERCIEAGATAMTRDKINNILVRGRPADVDELLLLAYVFDVAPAHLLAPGRDASVAITPNTVVHDGVAVERWVRGEQALPGSDASHYYAESYERLAESDPDNAVMQYARMKTIEQARQFAIRFNAAARQQMSTTIETLATIRAMVDNGQSSDDIVARIDAAVVNMRAPASTTTGEA